LVLVAVAAALVVQLHHQVLHLLQNWCWLVVVDQVVSHKVAVAAVELLW
jgi:hypothetical protein